MDSRNPARRPRIVRPEQGRTYNMGRMRAIFVADGQETRSRYSVSEWWLEARTPGPPVHQHEDDHVFYVVAGTLSLFFENGWTDLARGGYVLIPGNTPHTFENRGTVECGFICFNEPGGFEEDLPGIVEWFAENPLGDVTGP